MNKAIRLRLFLMMVLEFVIWGAWLPLIYGYLPSLEFTPLQQSCILNTFPVAATAAGGIFCAFWLFPRVLPRAHYPILLLAVPIVGCGVAVAAGGTWLFKRLGIAVLPRERQRPS